MLFHNPNKILFKIELPFRKLAINIDKVIAITDSTKEYTI